MLIERKLLALLALGFVATSCASNPYQKFYEPVAGATPARTSEPVQVMRGNNPDLDMHALMQEGYEAVGFSSFNAPSVKVDLALEQARTVGASLVVLYGTYTGTVSGTVPLVLPSAPATTTTTAQGSVVGRGGVATYSGSSTSTTSGGTTTYSIPYSVDRYDQIAGFWIKGRPMSLGIYFRDLDATEKQALQRNRGVVVGVVVKGTPAFAADILEGDILLALDGTEILDFGHLGTLIGGKNGQKVTLSLLRNGVSKTIVVQTNQVVR